MVSTEAKFAEACDALRKAGKFDVYTERSKGCTSLESKYVCALAILKEAGVKECFNESGEWQLLTEKVVKNNGTEFEYVTENDEQFSMANVDRTIMESNGFSEEQIARVLNAPPKDINEADKAEYDFLIGAGFSVSEATKLLKMPTYKKLYE